MNNIDLQTDHSNLYNKPVFFFPDNLGYLYRTKEISIRETTDPFFDNSLLILYVTSGSGYIYINKTRFYIEKGNVLLLHSFHVFSFEPGDNSHIELSCHSISYRLLNYSCMIKTPSDIIFELSPVIEIPLDKQEEIQNMLNQTAFEYQHSTNEMSSCLIIFGLLGKMVTTIFKYQALYSKKIDQPLGWRILNYITKYSHMNLTAKEVADHFHISSDLLNKELRKITSFGFSKTLNRARINSICSGILFRGIPVSYILRFCGFNSDNSFYRSFKSFMGITLKEYLDVIESDIINSIFISASDKHLALVYYIMENYRNPITPEDAAKELYITVGSINKNLKNYIGLTFHELVSDLRLQYAAMLLKTTDMTICDVSEESGFGSLSTFCRAFKNKYGINARNFKKN